MTRYKMLKEVQSVVSGKSKFKHVSLKKEKKGWSIFKTNSIEEARKKGEMGFERLNESLSLVSVWEKIREAYYWINYPYQCTHKI